MAAAQAHALLHTATLPYPCPAQPQPMATPCVQISRRGFLRGAEPQPGAQFFHGKCDSAGVFGKFPKIAPGGARGDSFVRCHVKVIRLFRNFTPRAGSQRMARLLRQRARARPSRCCCAARPALGRLRAVPREQAGVKDIPHGRTGATCLSTRPATARTAADAAMPWTAASIGYCLRRATCSTTAGRE